METFVPFRELTENPSFEQQRNKALTELKAVTIDAPIVSLIEGFTKLDFCFPLQSCYGHFLCGDQVDPHNMEHLPPSNQDDDVMYRIAYVAFCVDQNERGQSLLNDLNTLSNIDSEYIQLGCAEWFWDQQVNSYALQIEPDRFKTRDKILVGYQEALHIQWVRDRFFLELQELLDKHVRSA